MTSIKRIILQYNYKVLGLLTAGLSLLLLALLFLIVGSHTISKDNIIVQASMTYIILSPLFAIILSSAMLRFQNSSVHTFDRWVKMSFINFLISTFILSIAGFLLTMQKDTIQQILFERLYIILIVPIIGLTFSVITTLILKRG